MDDIELVDLFAMVSLHGHLSNPNVRDISYTELAEYSYELADAMMNARNNNGEA
ncbi:hypothetical protein UFOVP118_35 [uncultured Caudovirales phage]|uniref:Uncharacterized protein n=1 Tax=uncultured Caudovirales phage TaxID=2100421 RepID=A0A6J5L5Z2_9CAUD|nr:hypothetical protein UFOVP118_35 [uncultured Caudovirales phage]